MTSPTIGKELLIQLGSAYDCTTSNIEDRNSIDKKDSTTVYVIDATGDDRVNSGGATFRWNDAIADWILIQKDSADVVVFDNFESVIANGKVDLEHSPTNSQIWDISIIDENGTIISFPKIEDLTISGSVVSGLSAWNSNIIRFEYAYGSQEGSSFASQKDIAEVIYDADGNISEFVYADGSKKIYNRVDGILDYVLWTDIDGVAIKAKKTFIYNENGNLKSSQKIYY